MKGLKFTFSHRSRRPSVCFALQIPGATRVRLDLMRLVLKDATPSMQRQIRRVPHRHAGWSAAGGDPRLRSLQASQHYDAELAIELLKAVKPPTDFCSH
jgi:hypothetical protein